MNTKNDNSKFQYEALDEEIGFADILHDTSELEAAQQLQLFKPQSSTKIKVNSDMEAISKKTSQVDRVDKKNPQPHRGDMFIVIPIFVPCPAKYNRPVVITTCHKCKYFSNQNANCAIVKSPTPVGLRCSFQSEENERIVHPKNKLNELAGNEWMYFTKSVLQTSYPAEYGHNLRKKHGANKPPQLMKHIIEFFTKTGETVLDPFAGVGGTLLGASLCNRIATGIELNKEWIDIYHQVCEQENIPSQEMIHGNCLGVLDKMKASGQVYDFIATDPPYSIALPKTMCDGTYDTQNRKTDFESFSDSEDDLRNSESFEEYYQKMQQVFSLLLDVLKPNKYLTIIIRDSYQQSRYIPASYELAKRAEEVGFIFKGVKIQHGGNKRTRHLYLPADEMCIFPFVETLRLAKKLDGLTKQEIAIFVLTVFDAAQIPDIAEEIQKFRDELDNISGRVPRKKFIREFHQDRFRELYSEEISGGKITTRESRQPSSIDKFINTKVRNSIDIADAAIRYFRTTGLFTFGTKAVRLVVSPLKSQEVYQILNEMFFEPVPFYDDVNKFYEYLGNPDMPSLPWQTTNVMLLNLRKLQNATGVHQISESEFMQLTQNEQKEIILKLEETRKRQFLIEYEHDLQRTEMAKEIEEMFLAIRQKDVIDPPLYFEWNMWRALVCLNDCKCHPNFSLGDDFLPLSFAPGNKSDIEVEYNNDFVVLVEVTLSGGARQYDTEGEPVTRHIGKFQKAENERENPRTVYGLFVAPSINPNTANYFFVHLKHLPNPDFGGCLSIIPLSIQQFINIFTFCKIEHAFNRHKFRELLDSLVALGKNSNDSNEWTSQFDEAIEQWKSSYKIQ